MPTEKDDPESSTSEAESGLPEDSAPSEKQKQAATAKRRTKTGCLTCRRRRIKCGEEKPTCKNCIKSKRECAGYVQPLVYKQEHHAPPSTIPGRNDAIYRGQDQPFIPGEYLNMPMQQHHFTNTQPPFQPHAHHQPFQNHPQYVGTIPVQARAMQYQNMPADPSPMTWPAGPSHLTARYPEHQDFPPAQPSYGHMYASATPLPAAVAPFASSGPLYSQAPIPFSRPEHLHHPQYTTAFEDVAHDFSSHPQASNRTATVDPPLRQYNIHGFVQHPTLTNPVQSFAIPPVPTTHLGVDSEDAFEDPEDPFDVDMDDSDMAFDDAAETLQGMLDRSGKTNWQQSSQSNDRRRQPQTVATYRPTLITSPLRDERNERIFCHFVEITSHCMSIFERHHYSPISLPSRTLWNFTIPALAMSHAALAHSILALGALHLAKLQGLSEDNAVKHFTYSVRRVGKLLGLPKRRHEIATLATVLVLGFYEILTGDHSRWFLHLGGATRLMMEHDYAALTRTARRMRSGAKARVHQRTTQFALTEENYARVAGIPLALLDDVDWEVDAQLVSRLAGLPVDYDTQHQPGFPSPAFSMDLSTKDVEEFKVKMDLRWWYCKQDIFGSMISGDPLLMPFENYIYCPPRGQIGRADNPYATLDHMLLIMGRITDFGGKDRARKQRAVKAQGGQWRPPPWLFPQGPPGGPSGGPPGGPRGGPGGMTSGGPTRPPQHESQAPNTQDAKTVSPNTSGMQKTKASMAPSANEGRVRRQSRQGPPGESPPGAPPMYGMMPALSVNTEMNSAYKAMDASMKDPAFQNKREERQVSPPKSLEEETARAFAEHESITKAFDLYRSCLGPDFDPLPLSDVTPYSTPFGPALIYKNPAIANLWMFYNVGRILLHRFHPEMPPAAMISAGVTAHLTKDYAQMVGRICAGLYSPHHYGQKGPLDPGFAGALMESTFQLLFAAVQFQDAAQRGWTITKLQDVALRCGWQTSGAVAAACEIAWEKMGQAGRGPPYERTLDVNNKDVRVSGKFSRDASASTNNFRKSDDAVADYELEFVNHDRNLIDRSGSTRTHWALGLLSVEEDIKKMTIEEE